MLPLVPAARISQAMRQRPIEIRAGRRAHSPSEQRLHLADDGDGCRIRDRDHPIDHSGQKARLDSRPADALDARTQSSDVLRVGVAPALVERRVLWVDDSHGGVEPAESNVAPNRGARTPGTSADHDPARYRITLERHLLEDRFGDVVVAAPVRGSFGERELVEVETTGRLGQPGGHRVHRGWVIDEVAAATFPLDERDLLGAHRPRHHGDERQTQHPGEVGLADRRRTRRGLGNGRPGLNLSIAQGVQEQRSRQPMLQRSGGVRRFVLQVHVDVAASEGAAQRERNEVSIGGPVRVGLDPTDGVVDPLAGRGRTAVQVHKTDLRGVAVGSHEPAHQRPPNRAADRG